MELIYTTGDWTSLNEAHLTEIHQSLIFIQNVFAKNPTLVQKTIYKLQLNCNLQFLQKTINDFRFYYLSKKDKEIIKNELKNHKDFLESL